MRRPTIGVLALVDSERESYWMLPGYLEGLMQAGGLPVVLPPTTDAALIAQMVEECDGFLLTGGQDVAPELYGTARLPECGEVSELRDAMETELLRRAREAQRPVLGICRGIQFVNAALGGTLWQDLPSQRPTEVEHHMAPPYDRAAHRVSVVSGTPLAELLEGLLGVGGLAPGELAVNSYHHQAVRDVAPGLEVMAVSEDGLVEAVRDPSQRWLWATQWHPELSFRTDEASRRIFSAFVAACACE